MEEKKTLLVGGGLQIQVTKSDKTFNLEKDGNPVAVPVLRFTIEGALPEAITMGLLDVVKDYLDEVSEKSVVETGGNHLGFHEIEDRINTVVPEPGKTPSNRDLTHKEIADFFAKMGQMPVKAGNA